MHLRIRHEITCRFDAPVRNLVALLRLCPQSHEGQYVTDWRLDADLDCSLKARRDEFGNNTHTVSARGPLERFRIVAAGAIDTFDATGIVRGTMEPLPSEVFLRDTALTVADPELRRFAGSVASKEAPILSQLHALLEAVHLEMAHDAALDPAPAGTAFAAKSGSAATHAHVFIACARHLGMPSRFVRGYLVRASQEDAACHAWAETHVPGLGWVGFDTVNNLCPEDGHIRCATAFDSSGASFVRGADQGHVNHLLQVAGAN